MSAWMCHQKLIPAMHTLERQSPYKYGQKQIDVSLICTWHKNVLHNTSAVLIGWSVYVHPSVYACLVCTRIYIMNRRPSSHCDTEVIKVTSLCCERSLTYNRRGVTTLSLDNTLHIESGTYRPIGISDRAVQRNHGTMWRKLPVAA